MLIIKEQKEKRKKRLKRNSLDYGGFLYVTDNLSTATCLYTDVSQLCLICKTAQLPCLFDSTENEYVACFKKT